MASVGSWAPHPSLEREKEIRRRLFTSSITLAIRHFHVVVVQKGKEKSWKIFTFQMRRPSGDVRSHRALSNILPRL